MSVTAGHYAILSDALRVTTGHLAPPPQSARDAATEALAQLWQRQDGAITGVQLAGICHAAQAAADPIGSRNATAGSEPGVPELIGSRNATAGSEPGVPELIDCGHIGRTRASLMADISAAVAAHELAAHQLGSLRGPLMRPDLSDSPDGHDVAAHIDTAIRCGRAAYAVPARHHRTTGGDTPCTP